MGGALSRKHLPSDESSHEPAETLRRLRTPLPRFLVVGLVVVMVAASCGDGSRGDQTMTTSPTSSATSTTARPTAVSSVLPGAAEQVCRLMTDEEVAASGPFAIGGHRPVGPRSCNWLAEDDPENPVVGVTLSPTRDLEVAPDADAIGSPCEPGSAVASTSRRGRDALHVTCFVDGLAILLVVQTTDRAEVIRLLQLAGSRIGAVDRVALALPPGPPEGSESTTTTRPSVPPECLEAWRTGEFAPRHCEEYGEEFHEFKSKQNGG
jgi:hypothetical protein